MRVPVSAALVPVWSIRLRVCLSNVINTYSHGVTGFDHPVTDQVADRPTTARVTEQRVLVRLPVCADRKTHPLPYVRGVRVVGRVSEFGNESRETQLGYSALMFGPRPPRESVDKRFKSPLNRFQL